MTFQHRSHTSDPSRSVATDARRQPDPSRVSRTMLLSTVIIGIAFSGDALRYTIGWVGYVIVALVLAVTLGIALRRRHSQVRVWHLPTMLIAFVAWCALSTLWSQYPLETVMASAVQLLTAYFGLGLALCLTRFQFFQALGAATRILTIGSLLFELGVKIFAPHGLVPPAYLYLNELQFFLGPGTPHDLASIPSNFYWSHANLNILAQGDIQGLPGNRNLLAMIAVIALIMTVVQLWDRYLPTPYAICMIAIAIFVLVHAHSATAFIALAFVGLGSVLVFLGRRITRLLRWAMYCAVGVLLVAGAIFVVANNDFIFATMNRSSDMSGRGDIWRSVIELGAQSPFIGIGWISYWAPWLPQFDDLAVIEGATYYQAHNAFLDAWMQTGAIGVVLFALLTFTALIRTWWIAIDPPDTPLVMFTDHQGTHQHRASQTAAPFLILVALVVQSMTESRLLVEGHWMFLCWAAIYAKLRVTSPSYLPRHLHTLTGSTRVVIDKSRDT